jgi:hypothetical protein
MVTKRRGLLGLIATGLAALLLPGKRAEARTRFRQVLAKLGACWWVSPGPSPGPVPAAAPAGQRPAAAA